MVVVIIVLCNLIPEVVPEYTYLNCPARNKVVESNGWETMGLEENHQETKAQENHNMHVLEWGIDVCHVAPGCGLCGLIDFRASSSAVHGEYPEEEDSHELASDEAQLRSAIVKHRY